MTTAMETKQEPKFRCLRCDIEMEPRKTYFEYLGHTIHTEVPCCPKCGEVYIPEDLARGKIADIEQILEDK